MNKILSISNGIALIATIVINYLSNTGLLNGNTMKTVSDKYSNYFTPAGYAFSIWGLIYLGLLGFVCYVGFGVFKKNEDHPILLKIGWWFVLSCFSNALWVFAWLYDYTGVSVLLMCVLFISLLKIVINTRMELDHHPIKSYLFVFWPFSLYFGWISVAFIANIAAFLTKINWSGWGISEVSWTIIMICIAGFINVLIIGMRNMREYGLVGMWALIAIAVSNVNSAILYSCYVVTAIIFVSIIINALKSRGHSFRKKYLFN